MAHGKIIVQSNVDELDINRDYQPDHIIIGDAKLVLKQLISEVKKQAASGRAENQALNEEIKRVKDEWLNEWMPKLTSDETPINPYRVIWDLMHTVNRENTIITHDSGWPRAQLFPFWETIIPRGYIGWGHHTTMGYSLGGAMGAKLAKPEKMVINIMGDGSFGMVGMDFETAVREKIPILTIILNNSSLGHYLMDTPSTAVLSGNYAKVAEGLGGYSERVEKPDEIIPAIKRATKSLESNLAALLEIMVKLESAVQNYWTDKSVIDTATLD
jgi:acetolactate synthase-1/2/3 large subunit